MRRPEHVVCFDRDEAVSTNPHPDPQKPAVPLGWVKYLAHEAPGVDVWATGNQTLTREAAIPGMDRALGLWHATNGTPDSRFSVPDLERYDPARRDRLHIVGDLYETVDHQPRFIVVDDADLSNMARHGWRHFFPWEFVTAVESGQGPLRIPPDHGYSDDPFPRDHPPAPHFDPVE